MLARYYKVVAILTGDLKSGIMGPYANRGQDDIAMLNSFLTANVSPAPPKGLFIQGDGFVESLTQAGIAESNSFVLERLGLTLRSPAYQSLSGNQNDCADLLAQVALTGRNDIYASSNFCFFGNDVFNRNAALPEATEGGFYEPVGLNKPYISDMVHTASATHNWVAVTSGYDIEHLLSWYCDTDGGRIAWYYYMLSNVFASVCTLTGQLSGVGDTPQNGRPYTNFMKIGNSVMRAGPATVRLGIASASRVKVCVYDVGGRRVRTLADRVFAAGEHALVWDGTDDAGTQLARGVYFVRSSNEKAAGRIIVLNR